MIEVMNAIKADSEKREAQNNSIILALKLVEAIRHELNEGTIEVLPSKVYAALVEFEHSMGI